MSFLMVKTEGCLLYESVPSRRNSKGGKDAKIQRLQYQLTYQANGALTTRFVPGSSDRLPLALYFIRASGPGEP